MCRRRHTASCKEIAVLEGSLTRRKTTSGVVEMAGAAAWRSLFRLCRVGDGEEMWRLNKREMSRKNLQVCDM